MQVRELCEGASSFQFQPRCQRTHKHRSLRNCSSRTAARRQFMIAGVSRDPLAGFPATRLASTEDLHCRQQHSGQRATTQTKQPA